MLCNHDVTRTVTRYGRTDTGFDFATKAFGTPTDLALGTRRARAAALLSLALPGAVYVYQGEELGLPEAEIPRDRIQDPMHFRSGGTDPGRDGCRVPLPWTAEAPYAGFGRRPSPGFRSPRAGPRTRPTSQAADPGSMLALYREALRAPPRRARLRRRPAELARRPPTACWPSPARTALLCVVNLSDTPADLPAHSATPAHQRSLGRRGAAAPGHGGLAARLTPQPRLPFHRRYPGTPTRKGSAHAPNSH